MSKGRMSDLMHSLEAEGWKLLNAASMFEVESEVVHWIIERGNTGIKLQLDFHVFGELGEESDSLADILYCIVRGTATKLYFEKRESEKWKHALSDFLTALGRLSHSD